MNPRKSGTSKSKEFRPSVEPLEDRSLPSTVSYLVVAQSDSSLPAHFAQRIHAAGGEVRFTVPQIGIAAVKSDDPAFAARAENIPGVRSVVDAGAVTIDRPVESPPVIPPPLPLGPDVPVTPDELSYVQWNMDAIDAPEAWAQGVSGDGVRVAIIDTGFMGDHPDLRFNPHLSRSVMDGPPGETWVSSSSNAQTGWHGTAVAGIIAARDDDHGIVGVAPRADLVALRVIADSDGAQDDVVTMATVMRGMVYAADIHSDVINLSLAFHLDTTGYTYDLAGTPDDESDDVVMTPRDVAEVTRAFRRAANYAHDRGVVMVAGAGNDGLDYDQLPDIQVMPRDLPHVISVSATGPLGIANDPNTDLDVPAFYTNYGKSVIDLAAPGGNIDFELQASGQLTTLTGGVADGLTVPSFLFDTVFSTSVDPFPEDFPDVHLNPNYGTSFAAPHVSAVAALVIEAHGGRMDPDKVFRILKRTADDLGEPGKDAFYGHGRVNAAAAVARAQGHERSEYGGNSRHGWVHNPHPTAGKVRNGDKFASTFFPTNAITIGRNHSDTSDGPHSIAVLGRDSFVVGSGRTSGSTPADNAESSTSSDKVGRDQRGLQTDPPEKITALFGRDGRSGEVSEVHPLGREWTFGGVYVGDLEMSLSLPTALVDIFPLVATGSHKT
jgi:subtilisin family serine protease